MAVDTIGNVATAGLPPYVRDPVAPRLEAQHQGNTPAVAPLTSNAVAQATNGSGNTPGSTVKKDDLDNALKKVNEFVGNSNSDIQFTTDGETGLQVVKVIDRGSKEVIRQIPSEEMVRIAEALDKLQGLLIRQKA